MASEREWFAVTEAGDGITRITEPHVHPLLRANFWHVRGRDRDLVVGCGLGVASVRTRIPRGPTLARLLGLRWKLPDCLVTAGPDPSFDPAGYRLAPATVTRYLRDGDVVDLGDRRFTVLHVPGHSPGGVALYDEATRTLFSGDTVYDDELLDDIDGADPVACRRSMHRLRELPVHRCHAGHADSVDGARLRQLIDGYLTGVVRET